jgi:hypothetical protein
MKRGTRQTFKCLQNWGNFAGETVKIEPVATNVSISSHLCAVPKVKLELTPTFDETISVEYFNLTIKNTEDSTMNLTISDIQMDWQSIKENVTPRLPLLYALCPNQSETFKCNWSWDWAKAQGKNFTITVETEEGYEAVYRTGELPGVYLSIEEMKFDYMGTSFFDLTVKSSEYSTANATISGASITLQNGTTITLTPEEMWPQFPVIQPNQSLSIRCYWDWHHEDYRNQTITVNIYTKEGFTVSSKSADVPPAIVWDITNVKFDLDHTEYFFVNVTNRPCSLKEINVTKILLNGDEVNMTPPFGRLAPSELEGRFNCSIQDGWKACIGKNVTITAIAYITETGEELNISKTFAVPAVELKILGGDDPNEFLGNLTDPNTGVTIPYINVTISNSVNSLQNVTITKIVIDGTEVCEVDGTLSYPKLVPEGYILIKGKNVTIVCPWNYMLYRPTQGSLTITVYTAEGFQVSRIWYVV